MTQALVETVRPSLPHRGELHFRFELNDLPDMEFRHYVSGAAVSPDSCHVALADQSGDVYIVHRYKPENREFSWLYKVPTGISYLSVLALSEGASCLMILDKEDEIRIFSRDINHWREEKVRESRVPEIGFYHDLYAFVLGKDELLIKRKHRDEVVCRFIRWRNWWSGYFWKRAPVRASPAEA